MKKYEKRITIRFILAIITFAVLLFGWKYNWLAWIVPLSMLGGIITVLLLGNRYFCGNICPRGAFLDIFVSKISKNKSAGKFIHTPILKMIILIAIFGFFLINLYKISDYLSLTVLFWKMCLVTTLIGIILAFFINERAWCMICPIGTIEGFFIRKNKTLSVSDACVNCGKCDNACPIKIEPSSFKGGHIIHKNCLSCILCKNVCTKEAVR